jgi:predicted TIM-barrel fold metal-dependent hydrolase
MPRELSRRQLIRGALGLLPRPRAGRPSGVLVDTHIHLFSEDQRRFPYHVNAVYKPPPEPLEPYLQFIGESRIDHVIIVHPEPYQDDHSYLEYCFEHEPKPGFFKGTCLFDPIDPQTPARIERLTRKHPRRIVALRIHVNRDPKAPPTRSGAIRDRDLQDPAIQNTWRKAQSLGLGIQMHFIPFYASQIGALADKFQDVPVILDHLGRAGEGSPAQYRDVLKLAAYPRVYMKYSGVRYSSKQDYPYRDAKPIVRQAFDAFGPDRMLWGGLGKDMSQFQQAVELFDQMFDYASEGDRAKIRGLNAAKLFGF